MGKSGIGNSGARRMPSHPTLLTPHVPGNSNSILDAIDKVAISRETRVARERWWAWAGVPLLAITACWVLLQWPGPQSVAPIVPLQVHTQAADLPAVGDSAIAHMTAATPEPEATSPEPIKSPHAVASEASPFNRLENDALPQTALDAEQTFDLASPTGLQSIRNARGASAAPLGTKTKKTIKVAVVTPPGMSRSVGSKPMSRTSIAKTAVVKKTSPATTRDPDVDLLSALMDHLGGEHPSSSTGRPLGRSPQTIADLVKSCQKKDSVEATLCQRRICAGSWGAAEACPARLAPKSAVKTSAS